jgi:ATP-dependent Lon protease
MTVQAEPESHPVVPVRRTVLFPNLLLPIAVGRERSVAAVEEALKSDQKTLVVALQKQPDADEPAAAELHAVACLGVIRKLERSDRTLHVLIQGLERVRLEQLEQETPYLRFRVRRLPTPEDAGAELEALQRRVREQTTELASLLEPAAAVALTQAAEFVGEPLQQVYLLASMLDIEAEQQMRLLESDTRQAALQALVEILNHELEVTRLQKRIESETKKELSRQEREYVLRQQLRAIQQELGERSPEKTEVAGLRERLEAAELPEAVRKEVEKELDRLERKSAEAADYQLARTYVELVLELPWNETTTDVLDVEQARRILDEDHYDLQDVKDRILEHLAVMQLNPRAKAPILCFVGPPGVGKTSLGQSIARSLGRRFERISLGGLHDEAELRGHRRTYIGAMPGRVIQAVRRAGVRNPLLMLDEVDKLGRDFRGDPAAALMEILDPAQNAAFHDNYLDLPFDLSRVFFVATANTLDSIPRPLLDRMEILRLAGYSDAEKREIARRYLIERQRVEAGLSPDRIEFSDEALDAIIRLYTREAGVRELERMIGRICRKVARRIVGGSTAAARIRAGDLDELLGGERFRSERRRTELPAGVAPGLAWTESGGDVLYVEALLLPGERGLRLTGQLGEVMKESAQAAQSYVWSLHEALGIRRAVVEKSGVHIHVPAGAVPKDGPSAGVTMATALASLFTGLPARADTAMTGEITLTGLVLPIGGVKEKVLAAHRASMRRVILPAENEKDLRDVPPEVQAELELVLVRDLGEVLRQAIPGLEQRLAAGEPRSPAPAGTG